METINRPSIGFIVEGRCEHATYPSLVNRILEEGNYYTPTVVAEGYGGVFRNLPEHLDDLVRNYHPLSVIVTIDLIDVIDNGDCASCSELKTCLISEIEHWNETREDDDRMSPMPEQIKVVIQIQKLESWWLSDPSNLSTVSYFNFDPANHHWDNVDEEVTRPAQWLIKQANSLFKPKSPRLAKKIASSLDPEIMRQHSKSFDKFHREVSSAYRFWHEKLNQ